MEGMRQLYTHTVFLPITPVSVFGGGATCLGFCVGGCCTPSWWIPSRPEGGGPD